MSNKPKIYLVNPQNDQYKRMFEAMDFEIVANPLVADVLNFQGGADVQPALYGEKQIEKCYTAPARDAKEVTVYDLAVKHKKAFIGICRGGQFLNVMNGGKLWQHIDNHTTSHMATDTDSGKSYWVTSTHHQQMIPTEHGRVLLQAVGGGLSKEKISGSMSHKRSIITHGVVNDPVWRDVEAVWYPDTKSLCFQPHPEFHFGPGIHKEVFEIFKVYVDKYILGKVA